MHALLERVFGARRGSFRSHVLVMLSGTALSQAIPVALSPVLTRLYTPADLGVFALFSATAAVVGVAATARYELAIMLPEDDREAAVLAVLSTTIAVLVAGVGLLIVAAWLASRVLAGESVRWWIAAIPISAGLTGIFQTFNYWASRHKDYRTLATGRVVQTATTACGSLALALTGWGGGALVAASLMGQIAGGAVLCVAAARRSWTMLASVRRTELAPIARGFKVFPRINLLHALTDTVQSNGLVFVLTAGFGAGIVGLYSLTLRVLTAPAALFGASVSPVFYQRAAELHRAGGDLAQLVRAVVWRLALLGLPVFIIIAIWGPWLFAFVFGARWTAAGTFARILVPWIAVNFVISPLSQIPVVLGRQRTAFAFGVAYNLAILLPVGAAALAHWPVSAGLVGTSALACATLLVFVTWIYRIARSARWEPVVQHA